MDLPNSSNSSPLLMNNSAANGNNFGSSLVNGGFMGPNSNPGTQMGDYMSPGSGGPKSEPGSIKTEPSLNNTPPPGGLDPRFGLVHVLYLFQNIQWIPDIINVRGTTIGVSYNRTFLYPGFKRNEIASRSQDTH